MDQETAQRIAQALEWTVDALEGIEHAMLGLAAKDLTDAELARRVERAQRARARR